MIKINKIILVVIVIFLGMTFYLLKGQFSRKKVKQNDENDVFAATTMTANKKTNRHIASIPLQRENKNRSKVAILQEQLGTDQIGFVAFEMFDNFIKKKKPGIDKNSVCLKVNNCPVNLENFYREVFSRLPTRGFSKEKNILLNYMMASQLGPQQKTELLVSELTSAEYKDIPASSGRNKDGKNILSDDASYLLQNQLRLVGLGAAPKMVVEASVLAISLNQDPIARLAAAATLLEVYPKYNKLILTELNQAGVTSEQLSVVLKKFQQKNMNQFTQ